MTSGSRTLDDAGRNVMRHHRLPPEPLSHGAVPTVKAHIYATFNDDQPPAYALLTTTIRTFNVPPPSLTLNVPPPSCRQRQTPLKVCVDWQHTMTRNFTTLTLLTNVP